MWYEAKISRMEEGGEGREKGKREERRGEERKEEEKRELQSWFKTLNSYYTCNCILQ